MPTSNNPDNTELEGSESFDAIFQEYEQSHARQAESGGKQIEATVIAVSADSVYLDIGYKTEGVLPLAPFQSANEAVKPGDKFLVAVKGRNAEGYYELSRFRVEQPKDWSASGAGFCRQGADRRHGDRLSQRRTDRGCGRAGVSARLAQWSA